MTGLESRQGATDFSPEHPDRLWGSPASRSVGTAAFGGVLRPGSQVGHSPQCNAEVENELTYTCAPPAGFHSLDKENLTFVFTVACLADGVY